MGVCANPRAPRGSCCGGIGLNDMRRANVFIVSAVSAAVISLGLFYVLSSNGSSSGVEQNIPQTTIQIGDAVLFVEVLDTQEQRQEGLSGRAELATGAGALFIHEEPGMHGYWMKDMLFPIDLIWISGDLRVVEVAHNISPDTYPASFRPSSDALYVLETNACWASAHNVTKGSEVVIHIP